MEKYYKISETALKELLYDATKMIALDNGGVDNWSWYGESISDYVDAIAAENNIAPREDKDYVDLKDLVNFFLKDYEEIKE